MLGVARNTLYKPGKEDILQAWRGALKYHPDNPDALAGQAGALIDLGRYKEGLAASEWLCKKAPKLATAWLQRGRAFRFLERFVPAAKALRNAVTLDPGLGPAWHELGLATERLEEWPTVLEAWQCFLEIGEPPGFVDDIRKRRLPKAQKMAGLLEAGARWDGGQWLERAHGLEVEKDLDGADLCYTQALRKEPANTGWAVECGLNRVAMKHYDRALECAEAILRNHPNNGEALAIKGNSLFRLGEQAITARNYAGGTTDPEPLLSEAAVCLQRAAELNNDPGLLQMAGMALTLAGKGQQAQSLLNAVAPTSNGATLSVHISEPQPDLKQILDAAGKTASGGRIEQAVALYDQALAIDPSCLEAILEKGVGLSMLGRLDAALASFEQATRTAPNNHLPWDHKGTALARAKRGEEALVAFSEALRLSPDEPSVLIHQASTLAQLGRLKEAHDGYRHVLAIDAERIDCWAMLGEVEEHLGQPEQALNSYRRYLASPSASPVILGKLGPHVQKLEGNLRQNQMDDPQTAAELRKGQDLARAGRREDALKCFDKILTNSPNSAAAAYERGCVQYNLGLLDKATKSFKYSLNIDARQIMAWNMLSMCLAQLGQSRNAAEALAKATKLFPEHAPTWSNRANALSDLNQHEQALECAERATLLSPNLPQGWGNKGRALAELGRLEEALPVFIEGRRLAPRDPMHAANHALTLAKLGRYQEALPIATQAVQLGPSHPLALQVYQIIISNGK
ncbi:MAG: tetratricopeptide repeat protein [Desulfobulbaceae bacterium]|nr:tetratricopeptide repeat protein [Desulfobulbaceae bacterium]